MQTPVQNLIMKSQIGSFLSLVKFSHTVFALPFAMIGFFLAVKFNSYPFEWILFLLVLVCMITARNAAMAFNRWADRNIDADNPRTAVREIPAGIVSPGNALWFVILNSIVFILAAWLINPLCFFLSPVALAVVLGYSYTKRFTALCHFILGLGLAIVPTAGYLAVAGEFHYLPLLLSGAVLCWVSGFDIIYALQDEDFDKNEGLHSVPSALGKHRALMLSSTIHVLSAGFIIATGVLGGFGFWYWIGASMFCGLLAYQHTLVSPTDLSKVNLAFFTTNGIASVLFMAFVLGDLYL
ncbi:MAG: 4-hydroxybenzoate polyprenyltransferase [Limisphaerales bacterium]|jgi:4-hydroxybenzoate polyprenyltransferase